jgi:hypothetical protein
LVLQYHLSALASTLKGTGKIGKWGICGTDEFTSLG